MKTYERPTRKDGGQLDDYVEEHPAYATIGASRVSSSPGAALFGSDFRHQHYMTVTIRKANLRRGLSNDWTFGHTELIEVALSEAQWATFVATPNMGTGTPCTLEFLGGEGYVPGIEPITDRRAQANEEVARAMAEARTAIEELRDAAPSKKLRELAEKALRRMSDSTPWAVKQFDEHMERTVETAKIEVNAYLTSAVQRAGLEALGATPMLELTDGEAAK